MFNWILGWLEFWLNWVNPTKVNLCLNYFHRGNNEITGWYYNWNVNCHRWSGGPRRGNKQMCIITVDFLFFFSCSSLLCTKQAESPTSHRHLSELFQCIRKHTWSIGSAEEWSVNCSLFHKITTGKYLQFTIMEDLYDNPGPKKVHFDQSHKEERVVNIYVSEESLTVYENPWMEGMSAQYLPRPAEAQHPGRSTASRQKHVCTQAICQTYQGCYSFGYFCFLFIHS